MQASAGREGEEGTQPYVHVGTDTKARVRIPSNRRHHTHAHVGTCGRSATAIDLSLWRSGRRTRGTVPSVGRKLRWHVACLYLCSGSQRLRRSAAAAGSRGCRMSSDRRNRHAASRRHRERNPARASFAPCECTRMHTHNKHECQIQMQVQSSRVVGSSCCVQFNSNQAAACRTHPGCPRRCSVGRESETQSLPSPS